MKNTTHILLLTVTGFLSGGALSVIHKHRDETRRPLPPPAPVGWVDPLSGRSCVPVYPATRPSAESSE